MKRTEIMATIKSLAASQGFYSRMYSYLTDMQENDPGTFNRNMTALEDMHFDDAADLVIYLES